MRTGTLLSGVAFGLLLLGVQFAAALPIRVTDQVIVEQLLKAKPVPMAARAGWYGPEIHPAREFNISYEQYGPAATRWRTRQEIGAAFVPAWQWLVVIALTIFLVRAILGRMERGTMERRSVERGTTDGATPATLTGNKPLLTQNAVQGNEEKAA